MQQRLRLTAGVVMLIILVLGIIVVVRPSHQVTSTNGNLNVVAAENFWGDIASQLGGSHVHVTSIITDPTADPHLYESSAQNASEISSASVVIVNGLGYDDFMNKLLSASPNTSRQVLTVAAILGITGDTANRHLWYNIPRMHEVAGAIATSFEIKDPAHKADYEKNLIDFNASLLPIIAVINQIKSTYNGAPVAYTERVPGYLLTAAGLTVKTPDGFAKSIEDATDPSPADSQAMSDLMTNKRVRALLYNSQATSPVTEHVKNLAKQAGIPVIGVTETLPTNEKTYQSWQQDQLNVLLKALQL
jgi:zinc/manganese transport system substrate-binding protein